MVECHCPVTIYQIIRLVLVPVIRFGVAAPGRIFLFILDHPNLQLKDLLRLGCQNLSHRRGYRTFLHR